MTILDHTDSAIRANLRSADRILTRPGPLGLDDEVQAEEHLSRADALLARRDRLAPAIGRISEPDVYAEHGPHSFFRDLVDAHPHAPLSPTTDRGGSLERLLRHQRFTDEQRTKRSTTGDLAVSTNNQQRADSSAAGAGGEFEPPQWILDQFASVARGVAPLRSLARSVPLPPFGTEVSIPRFDVAAGVMVETISSENTAPTSDAGTTDSISSPVVTLAGELPMSLQLYERSPGFDKIWAADMGESLASVVEQQLIAGTGTGGQLLGVLNVSGTNAVTYTSASPTGAGVIGAVANAVALVADNRKRPADVVIMRGARYAWIASQLDTAGNTLQRLGTGQVPEDPDEGFYGPVGGVAVVLDDAVPVTSSKDVVIALRSQDIILLESTPKVAAVIDANGLAGTLSVALTFHSYAACFTSRYPSAIGVVSGTGLTVPAGW